LPPHSEGWKRRLSVSSFICSPSVMSSADALLQAALLGVVPRRRCHIPSLTVRTLLCHPRTSQLRLPSAVPSSFHGCALAEPAAGSYGAGSGWAP
jgi:hypothetical protein